MGATMAGVTVLGAVRLNIVCTEATQSGGGLPGRWHTDVHRVIDQTSKLSPCCSSMVLAR